MRSDGQKKKDDSILPCLDRVSFELSNRCNYAPVHPKCPAHLSGDPVFLPLTIITDVLDTLGDAGFCGGISFHNYNEPLIDPRLFKCIEYAKKCCPKSQIVIWTNGWSLNQTMMDELTASGVTILVATAYTEQEKERLCAIRTAIEYTIIDVDWAHVIDADEMEPVDDPIPCYAPLTDLRISKEGLVVLCCRDWKNEYVFYDLNKVPFRSVLHSRALLDAYDRLRAGDRYLPLCKRCRTARDWRRLRQPPILDRLVPAIRKRIGRLRERLSRGLH